MNNNFKKSFLMIIFALIATAHAAEKSHSPKTVSTFLASAPGLGTLRVEVKDVGEPVYRPLNLTVTVTCKNKGSTKKTPTEILKQDSICDYRDARYDERNKTLTIHYSTAEFSLDQTSCNGHWSQTFDLRELCTTSTP